MPPRKKARKAAPTSENAAELAIEEAPEPMDIDPGKDSSLIDPWTDEQETSLFKSMIRWKPVGMHKHFRMVAISENLRNHGYTSAKDDHTRIPGIWEKLNGLYNLEALDEREHDVGNINVDEKDPATEPFYNFALPEDDYGDDMFAKREAPEGSQSPPALNHGEESASAPDTRRQSTIDDTEDLKSSAASTPGKGSVRGTRKRARGGSQLKEVSIPITVRGRSGRGKQEAKKDDQGEDDDGKDEEEKATPKATAKGGSKASGSKANRRKSVRKR